MKISAKYLLLFALPLFLLAACDQEQVIQVDLSDAPPQLVIEGRVTDEAAPWTVRITRSVRFDAPNDFPPVSGAVVIVRDDTGQADTLYEKRAGEYETAGALAGVPGRTYTLEVRAEGQVFTARSTMPDLVPFEDLRAVQLPFGEANTLVVSPVFTDPAGPGNCYQFVQSTNGRREPFIFVTDDRNNDGAPTSTLLFAPDLKTQPGDTVVVEMRSIDRATYQYFVALDASGGNGPNASVPANPDNNFGGACLGYFAAHTVQRRTLIAE